ncbi:hypothetical protein KEJ29_06480 [Candidatus Bathyarchaeota archaeon]|nr:hypothetical protein [Candidatus Bathyarchaeota archaeon]
MEKIKAISRTLNNIGLRFSHHKNRISVCPRCGSRNIGLSSKFDAWLMPKRYACRDCGYVGPIVLEVDLEE